MENVIEKTNNGTEWTGTGFRRVTRNALEAAGGTELDALVAHVGLLRLGPSPAMPEAEGDLPLRNRALEYADDWGLLEDDENEAERGGAL